MNVVVDTRRLRDALRAANRLHGERLIPRGVYRFKTHEEAEESMIRTIASSKTQRDG